MFLAIDRVTKFAYVEFHDSPGKIESAAFLRGVVQAFPYQIRIVLTDNGVAFTKNASTKWDAIQHPFDRACNEHGIEHRLDPAIPPLPSRPGRTHEPNRQGRDHQGVPLQHHPSPACPRHRLRVGLQLRQAPQGTQIRAHWKVENTSHYSRDVTLGEDRSRIRTNPGMFARLRSFAFNILKANRTDTLSQDRYRAGLAGVGKLLKILVVPQRWAPSTWRPAGLQDEVEPGRRAG